MRKRLFVLCLALGFVIKGMPACAAPEDVANGDVPVSRPGFHYGSIDNMRFGLSSFQDVATATLFAGTHGISAGFDYNIGRGLAIGVDSINLYRDIAGTGYFLSVNPVQVKYRFGLPFGDPAVLLPYGSVGAGLAFMGLLGAPDGLGHGGLGYSGSVAVGLMLNDNITFELGYGGGRVGGVTDYGLQTRFGTSFDTLGDLPFLPWRPSTRRVAEGGGGGPTLTAAKAGFVEAVAGDQLNLRCPRTLQLAAGSDVQIYVDDGITLRIATARVESLGPDGSAVARVTQASEPIKVGYRFRGL
jgi:hypothetical protein